MHPLALLNTTIITTDGSYTCRTMSVDEARDALVDAVSILNGYESFIGHEATAQIMATVLGYEVSVNRQPFEQMVGQHALVFKLRGRAPEGVILDREQVEAIGYNFKLLSRTA